MPGKCCPGCESSLVKASDQVSIHPLRDIPLVHPGDDLAGLIGAAISRANYTLCDGDVVVVAQKVVSKAEGRLVRLDDVQPSSKALRLAEKTGKDPRMVELILRESTDVIRTAPGVIIVRHRLGLVSANAGIDQSNIDHGKDEHALLLPLDPDQSARLLRDKLTQKTGKRLGVIISDSVNRPWRLGSVGIAIGCAGVTVLDDRRGRLDLFGRELKITLINHADSIATTALLLMGETSEGVPAAVVSGFAADDDEQSASDSIRPMEEDLFL